jgi:hypothetical protein
VRDLVVGQAARDQNRDLALARRRRRFAVALQSDIARRPPVSAA